MGSKQHSLVASASVPASELLSGVPALTSLYGAEGGGVWTDGKL